MSAGDPVGSVLGPDYRKPFMLLVAVVVTVVGIMLGLTKAEQFVDGRVELRLAAQKQVVDDHEKRLSKIEEKLGNMNDVLAEIRSDVKVLRAKMER